MKALHALVNSLLSFFIVLSGTTFVANRVADANYLSATAEKSGIYNGVSEVASRQLAEITARNLGVPVDQVPAEVSQLVTAEYVAAKSQEINTQVEELLRGERNKITIDFTELATQAQAAGVPINSTDLQPIEIEAPQNISQGSVQTAQRLDFLQFLSVTLATLLLLASVVLSIIRKSLLGLSIALFTSGVVFAGFALIGLIVSGALVGWLNLPESITELTPYAQSFIQTIISDVNRLYGWFALGLIVVAIILFIIHKFTRPKKPLPQTNQPSDPGQFTARQPTSSPTPRPRPKIQ